MKREKDKETMETTKSDGNTLAFFLKEINRIPLLSREEEEQTARDAMKGNRVARERLVSSNLRFVVNIAKRYQGLGMPLEDLIAEGNIGLVNAVDRFDIDKNCRFISYAVWWIRQAILSALCERSRMIRLPANRAAELVKIEKAKKLVKKQHSPEEEINEIAALLNMKKEHVLELLAISRDMLSLETHVSQEHNSLLKDLIEDSKYMSPYAAAEESFMKDDIESVLSTLNKDEAEIIRCHYGLGRGSEEPRMPMSLKEIGVRYNLSKERIRQIEEKALSRLKNPLRKKKLQTYVA
jgi:RNA polymerase primary sigma factor